MERWEQFRSCPGCGFDFATGEGEKGCHHYDCPYLPEELDVFCPQCRFDFFTMEGNPSCDDPATCPHGQEARSHVENVARWRAGLGVGG
jgi:hypothetical protein